MIPTLRWLLGAAIFLSPICVIAQPADGEPTLVSELCRAKLDAIFSKGSFPGGSAALVLADGSVHTFTVGLASKEPRLPMLPTHRMLAGSIGKTYVTAAAHHLVAAGKIALDDEVSKYLGDLDWYPRLQNADALTIRQLLQHSSGIPRYVFDKGFWDILIREQDKEWRPEELIGYVLDAPPLFAAGEGWAYADTNYLVVGMIIEKVTGEAFYDYVKKNLLSPHGLNDTVPSDRRKIHGLAQGYAGFSKALGVPDRVLEDGVFVFNPQFEWCGGGYATTPADLARWARILYRGEAFEAGYLETMLKGVTARGLGPETRYGLGAMLRKTRHGELIGHDGMFPGYLSTMGYFPKLELAAAFQVNCGDGRAVGMPFHEVLVELADGVTEASKPKSSK